MLPRLGFAFILLLAIGAAGPALAQDGGRDTFTIALSEDSLERIGGTLLWLFVIAALVQTALTVIFSWRWYVLVFEGTGMKVVINLVIAAVIVFFGNLNAFDQIIEAVIQGSPDAENAPGFKLVGQILTALILAGGTESVHRLALILGLKAPEQVQTRQDEITGYGKVWVTRRRDTKAPDMDVFVNDNFAGTITRDSPRFPAAWPWSAVGYPVNAGDLEVTVRDRGAPASQAPRLTWDGKINPRAKLRLRVD